MSARIWKRRRAVKVDIKWKRRESKKLRKILDGAANRLGFIFHERNW